MSAVGTVVAGRFRLERPLGAGGMGEVWVAFDERLAARCAVKFLQPTSDPEANARFLREAQTAAQLRSPYVVAMLDHGVSDGRAYLAMELLEGEDLSKRLRRLGALDPGETVRIVTHIGRALSRAHALGLIHRDLKPANIVVVKDEDGPIAKVLDFGIAKVTTDVRLDSARLDTGHANDVSLEQTIEGHTLGTPTHMSPEHVNGLPVDHRSDLWALGVVAYECVTGLLPFRARSLGELVNEITAKPCTPPSALSPTTPAAVDAWFERALAKNREARFGDAKEMTDALAAAFGVASASAPLLSAAPPRVEERPPVSLPFARTEAIDTRGKGPGARHPLVLAAVGVLAIGGAAAWLGAREPRASVSSASPSGGAALESDASSPTAITPFASATASAPPPYAAMKIVEIGGNSLRMCVRFEGGSMACWGTNARLGETATWEGSTTAVPAAIGIVATSMVNAGGTTCVHATDGPARCFNTTDVVARFMGDRKPTKVALTVAGVCGVLDSSVQCAGFPGMPVDEIFTFGEDVSELVIGGGLGGCFVKRRGGVSCWMPGPGFTRPDEHRASLMPREVHGVSQPRSIAAGLSHACIARSDGRVVCLGDPLYGVLGSPDRRKPVEIGPGITQLEPGDVHQLHLVPNLAEVVKLATGSRFNCALTKAKEVHCWGANDQGQLGRGTRSDSEAAPALALTDVEVLGAASDSACAVRTDGAVHCWGAGAGDQLARTETIDCGSGRRCQPKPSPASPW